MIALAEAQARLLDLLTPVSSEMVRIEQAVGRWLAADIVAKRNQPARDLSAMDGYAVGTGGARQTWSVIGESAAGAPFAGTVGNSDAVRIFTGAALPVGCDSIIIQENVTRSDDVVALTSDPQPRPGDHVRKRGGDFIEGALLISSGVRLESRKIALAAMAGHGEVLVRRPVRIAVISTGNELVPPGVTTDDDHIPATNALMIAAMLADWPVEISDIGIVGDTLDALGVALERARNADIIVTSGGASVGDHDLVRPALLAAGAALDFWKVAMRPGKPLMAGKLGDSLVLGLPGNPVSAYVTATLFLKPAIAALSGAAAPLPQAVLAMLGAPLPAVGTRTDHIRAKFVENRLIPAGIDDSAALSGLAQADGLIVRPAGSPPAETGEFVPILLLA